MTELDKLTKDQETEILKCSTDFNYFVETYISDYKVCPEQKDLANTFIEHGQVVCKTSRQIDTTSTVCLVTLWYTLFNGSKRVFIDTPYSSLCMDISNKIKTIYHSLPLWMQYGIVNNSPYDSIEFKNGSFIKVHSLDSDISMIRGLKPFDMVIFDEIGHIKDRNFNVSRFMQHTLTKQPKINMLLISTYSSNKNSLFELAWTFANSGMGSFKPFLIQWNDRPCYDGISTD